MKNIIVLFALALSVNVVLGEGPPVEWEKTFGGSSIDRGYSVQQTLDGGYVIAGNTLSLSVGSSDAWLIKTDADGNDIWDKTFGGSDSDWANFVQQTSDGGYIVAAGTYSYGPGGDAWLIKTDADGNDIWKKTFGGNSYDSVKSVQQTDDGGYIGVGWTSSYGAGSSDIWLIRTDSDGNEVWNKTFGGSLSDNGWSVRQTPDGGYIIAGYTYSYGAGSSDAWLIKTDSDGNEVWNKTFGGSGHDLGYDGQQTEDGGYIIVGHAQSSGIGDGVWLIKTAADGNEVWNKTFGRGVGWSVQQTVDGGYIIAASTDFYGGVSDIYLIKADSAGNEIWRKTFGGSRDEIGHSVQQTSDGGYIVAGYTNSYGTDGSEDVYLIRVSADCINQPRSDLTGDCKTDFRDFAVMCSEWLDCGQYDPNDCL